MAEIGRSKQTNVPGRRLRNRLRCCSWPKWPIHTVW